MAGRWNIPIIALVLIALLQGCSGASPIQESAVGHDWYSPLSASDLATIRQTFPDFMPELFAPGTDPLNRLALRPTNFRPARFFGEAVTMAAHTTTQGVELEFNGYDTTRTPDQIGASGTYFDPQRNPIPVQFGIVEVAPLNKIEARMNLPLTPGAPAVVYDRRDWRVRSEEVDRILVEVRDSLALRLPNVANVPLSTCRVTIRSSIFYVQGSNFGDTWAGGVTRTTSGGKYHLEVSVFYISAQRLVTDWRAYLIDEAINFFVLSVGRGDLAR